MCFTSVYSAHNVSECCLVRACVVSFLDNYKSLSGDQEMTQRVKTFAIKPDDLSPIPGIHKVEGENSLLQVVLKPLAHTYKHAYVQVYTCSNK